MQIGEDVGSINYLFVHWNEQVARFSQRSFVGIDNDSGALDSLSVYLAGVWLERADQIQVRSRTKPVSIKQRLRRGGAGANYIGFSRADSRIHRLDLDPELGLNS